MKDQFLNIFRTSTPAEKLKLNKRLSAILVCFLIALVFWFLIALSKDYSTSLTFPIGYNNLPGQKVVVNNLPSTIRLNIRASGFRILSYRFKKEKSPVEIDVDARIGTSFDPSGDVLVIPTKTFAADFYDQLGSDVSIVNFIPDSIVFNFSYKSFKRVPVKLNARMSFEKQYDTTGAAVLKPDSVNVSGPSSVIDKINFISTERISLEKVRDSFSKKLKLESNRLLTLSDSVINVTIPVEKFTEENVEVPVNAIHVPKGYSLKTFPDKANVKFHVALSRYNEVNASRFEAIVDAINADNQKASKLKVELISFPSFIKFAGIEPERVDYILRKQ
jgi:YbbR domain-containing protein